MGKLKCNGKKQFHGLGTQTFHLARQYNECHFDDLINRLRNPVLEKNKKNKRKKNKCHRNIFLAIATIYQRLFIAVSYHAPTHNPRRLAPLPHPHHSTHSPKKFAVETYSNMPPGRFQFGQEHGYTGGCDGVRCDAMRCDAMRWGGVGCQIGQWISRIKRNSHVNLSRVKQNHATPPGHMRTVSVINTNEKRRQRRQCP